jgi:V-type H+-transporting ATPase subunit A
MATFLEDIPEIDIGSIDRILGPCKVLSLYQSFLKYVLSIVVVVTGIEGLAISELVYLGYHKCEGEVIKLQDNSAFIQVYDDNRGLAVGDPAIRRHHALSVELGPGIFDAIFDGIQRPLNPVHVEHKSSFLSQERLCCALDRDKKWQFKPINFREGQFITGGDVFGEVYENELISNHKIICPPNISGEIVAIYGDLADGNDLFHCDEPVLVVYNAEGDKMHTLSLFHSWPVRKPRPIADRLPPNQALTTGVRILDALFPCTLGGTCTIPGAFGCGKGLISQSLAKYSNYDSTVYVGCGERGNEITEVLAEFPEITMSKNGKNVGIMKRTTLVANTANMPVAAREASIFTGITIAEYFRDQGMNTGIMADSLSRWAEALREISSALQERPGDFGFPTYLGSRLTSFYERAGRVKCLGTPHREGSLAIIGSVSPPGGDFSEPVTSTALSITQVFWALDKKLAQRKQFPSINWDISFSNYAKILDSYYNTTYDDSFSHCRKKCKEILAAQPSLLEAVQFRGRNSLTENEKLIIDIADIIIEDFLAQNAFTQYDHTCPLPKTIGMLKCIILFYDQASNMINESKLNGPVTWEFIKTRLASIWEKLRELKFSDPKLPANELTSFFNHFKYDIGDAFIDLSISNQS